MNEHAKERPHLLQGPHTEVTRAGRNQAVPLRLRLMPADAIVEVDRADVIVGRHSQADVHVMAPEASRRHCRLVCDNGQWRVIDLHSLNGVYVNDERVHEAPLYDGDRVRIAGCTLIVESGAPAPRVIVQAAG
jgi:pSer/pThr/pTyr-binding forkhead associated (FHA) protein